MATDISKMAAISLGLLSGPPELLVNFFSSSFSVLVFLSCPHIFFYFGVESSEFPSV